ncbi:PLxRFG domain-containing protein [Maridesulfovibrio bastinii]|uniref:PLxRFG domain-containing protein n=1 Tax=Maridesulfovibrio bastinii TaxID=47157 RepID=UPI0004181EB5|nr:PLxRFG domain-containing protein [Maridesulfovibrio bastinii]
MAVADVLSPQDIDLLYDNLFTVRNNPETQKLQEDDVSAAGAVWDGLKRIPGGIVDSVGEVWRGGEDEYEDRLKRSQEPQDEYLEKYGNSNKEVGLGLKVKDFAGAMNSLPYSLLNSGVGLATGAGTSFVAGPGAGWVAGTSSAGVTAYRGTKEQFVQDYFNALNNDYIQKTGKNISKGSWVEARKKLEDKASEYGLWEALPEAIGGAVGVATVIGKLNKFLPKGLVSRLAAQWGLSQGEEQLTETITGYGQGKVEAETGLREEAPTVSEAFKAQAPSTFLMTNIMGGGTKAGHKVVDLLRGENLNAESEYDDNPSDLESSLAGDFEDDQSAKESEETSKADDYYDEDKVNKRYDENIYNAREEGAAPFDSAEDVFGMDSPEVTPNKGKLQPELAGRIPANALPLGKNNIPQPSEQTAYDVIPSGDGENFEAIPRGEAPLELPQAENTYPPIEMDSPRNTNPIPAYGQDPNFDMVYTPDFETVPDSDRKDLPVLYDPRKTNLPVPVNVMSNGRPYSKKGIDARIKSFSKQGRNVEAVQLDNEGKKWGWKEQDQPSSKNQEIKDIPQSGVEHSSSFQRQQGETSPSSELILSASGQPFKAKGVKAAAINRSRRTGKQYEPVEFAPGKWGLREVKDEDPKSPNSPRLEPSAPLDSGELKPRGRSDFEERKENRIERLQSRAAKASERSHQLYEDSDLSEEKSGIPFGQPILVGHHSEKAHRRALERAHRKMDQSIEEDKKAKAYAQKAAAAEKNNAISSDDPEALVKLKDKISELEKHHEMMKAANKVLRSKKLTEGEKIEKLVAQGFKEKVVKELLKPDYLGRVGFAPFSLQNNSANIRRNKQRLAYLQRQDAIPGSESTFEGGKIVDSVEENRVQIFFDGKPSQEMRTNLKKSGFRWAPKVKAWQRMRNANALRVAKDVVGIKEPDLKVRDNEKTLDSSGKDIQSSLESSKKEEILDESEKTKRDAEAVPVLGERNSRGRGSGDDKVEESKRSGAAEERSREEDKNSYRRHQGSSVEDSANLKTEFSFSNKKNNGMPLAQIEPAIAELEKKAINSGKTVVVQSVEDLPEHIQEAYKSQGNGDIEAAYSGGITYFVADNISSPKRAVELWMHEQGLHHGIRNFFSPKEMKRLLNHVHLSAAHSLGYKDIVNMYGLDMSKEGDRHIASEEYLARIAEKVGAGESLQGRDKTIWRKLIDMFKKFFKQLRFSKSADLSYADIEKIVSDIVSHTIHGQKSSEHFETEPAVAFSKKDAKDSVKPESSKEDVRLSLRKASSKEMIDSLNDPKVRNFINIKDLGLLQEVGDLPHWISKSFPEFKKIYERQLARMDERSSMFSDSLKEVKDFFSGISDSELKEVSQLIWALDGKNLKEVKASKFLEVKDDKGRPVRENGRVILKSNPEHYEELNKWLKKKPVSGKARKAFLDIRKSLDNDFLRAYDAMRQMSEIDDNTIDEFRKQINHVQNYFPHHRYGNYYVAVYGKGKDGKRECIYREHYDAKTTLQANKIGDAKLRALKKKYPDALNWDKGKNKKLPDEVYGVPIDTNALEQIVTSAASSIADPERAGEIRTQLSQAVSDVLKTRGWGSHAIGRQGIPGHEKADIRKVLYDYKAGLTGWLTKMEASRDFTKAVGEIDARKNPKLYKYALTYVRNMLRNSDSIDRAVGNFKALAFAWYLGGNVKTAALNLTQNIITGAPRLGMETGASGVKVLKAAGDSLVAGLTKDKNLKSDEQRLMNDMYKEGVITEAFLDEIKGQVSGMSGSRYWNQALKWLGVPMAVAERFNRAMLALAAYRAARNGQITRASTLKSLGLKRGEKASYEMAKKFAEIVVRDAHFVYGKANMPQAMRDSSFGRVFLSTSYTFRTFSHNLIRLWSWMLKSQGKAGAKAFTKSLASTAVLGGVTALPFYYSLMAVFQSLTGNDDDWTEEIRKSLPENDTMRDIVCYGVPSVAGVNLGGSLSMEVPLAKEIQPGQTPSSIVRENLGEILGIPYDLIVEKQSKASQAVDAGDKMRAIEAVAPTVLKNVMAAYRLFTEGQTSVSGKPINEPGKYGPRKLSFVEAITKGMGFQPIANTKNWDQYRARRISSNMRSSRLASFSSRLARAVRENKTDSVYSIYAEINKWNQAAIQNRKPWLLIMPEDIKRGVMSRMKNSGIGKRQAYRYLEQREAW